MEYLVIGAGPAGPARHFLEQAGRDYLILETGNAAGTFFRTFPRHRRLISINKPHTGWDDPEPICASTEFASTEQGIRHSGYAALFPSRR
jgi:hypothetical protein